MVVRPKVSFHLSGDVLDAVLDGLLIVDETGRIVFVNQFARTRLFGNLDAVLDREVWEVLPSTGQTSWQEVWERVSQRLQQVRLDFLSLESVESKQVLFFDATVIPRIGIDSEFKGAVCLLHFASPAEKLAMEVEAAKETIERQLRQLEEFSAIGDEIVGETDLGHVLKRVAEAIREHSNFSRVVVSRFLDGGQREIACAGISEQEERILRAHKWSERLSEELFHDRFRIGHSYYVPHGSTDATRLLGIESKASPGQMQDWHPKDFLFIPLYGRGRKMIGMISVDDPKNGRAPTAETLRPLELFAAQAARAIEEAQLKKELLETKDNLRRLIDSTPDAIIATDSHGVITFYSDGAQRMFGYLPNEIVGKHIWEYYAAEPQQGRQRARGIMQALLDSPTETITEKVLDFRKKDGGWVPITVSAGLLRNESGEVVGTIGVARDISEDIKLRRQIMEKNRKLEAKNRELEEFVYVASHDLQAPLVSIQGFATKLTHKYKGILGAEGLHYLSRLNANVSRMSLLLKSLLELSRASTIALQKTATDLSQVVEDVLEDYAALIKESHAVVLRPSRLPVVHCDEVQIAQVLSNLVGNALRYRAQDRRPIVEIGSLEKEDRYLIYVRDNGIGIDESDCETVFRPFRRLRKKGTEGIGIGLSIAKRIVERHRGRIWAEPNKDAGCTFYFELPKRQGESG